MPQPLEPREEPNWVKRLRARGFDVRGGEGNLPLEPLASFPPMPERRIERVVRAILNWFPLPRERRHAPVP